MKKTQTDEDRMAWWEALEPQWKRAFNQAVLQHGDTPKMPTPAALSKILEHKFLRFAGPAAPYPNMSFELTNLSGLAAFEEAELISVTYHRVESLKEIAHLTGLASLFVDNNRLTSLEGVERMTKLVDLYVHHNRIESIQPIEKLLQLRAFYCGNNQLTQLDGLTEDHSDNLRFFVCLPNDGLKQREIIRVENTLGIKCKGVN